MDNRLSRVIRNVLLSSGIIVLCGGESIANINGDGALIGAGKLLNTQKQTHPVLPENATAPDLQILDIPAEPTKQSDSGKRVVITSVNVDAGKLQNKKHDAEVQALLQKWLNKPLSFSELQQMTYAVTNYYREAGYPVARAILPPQKVTKGQLAIRVIEGRMSDPAVNNNSRLKTSFAEKMVRASICEKTCPDTVVSRERLARTALLLNELPGVDAGLALRPGKLPETTQLDVSLKPGQRFSGYIGVDNFGTSSSGEDRVVGGFTANELLGYADQLNLNVMRATDVNTWTGSIDYNVPVNYYGTRVGLRYSHLNYNLTGPFSSLDANGYLDEWDAYATHPLIRSFKNRLDARLDLFHQEYKDELLRVDARRRNQGVTVGLNGQFAVAERGVTTTGISATLGDQDVLSDPFGQNASQSTGKFSKLNLQLGHEQGFGSRYSAFGQISGQLTDTNLDGSQKMILGGPTGVRAYEVGSGGVDEGTLFTGELRSRWMPTLPSWMGSNNSITGAVFYDQGIGHFYRNAPDRLIGSNRIDMSGAGSYVALEKGNSYSLRLTWAHRTGDRIGSESDDDQWWASFYKVF
ncbi:MAG: ShlB/FhaC/HecB family hemolysin secretion/activation protein [Hafnia sp.]